MGDLNKGETFSAGETVSAARLHRLVEDATLKAGVVTTTKIADGAITTAKLASSVALTVSAVTISENKVLVGNASGIGAEVAVDTGTMNPAGFGVKALGIAAAQLAADAVETAKIKDANVTLPKLAAQAATTIVANATGSSASPTACALGTGLEFSGGALRVTAAVSSGIVIRYKPDAVAFPASDSVTPFTHGLGDQPMDVQVWIECTADDQGYLAISDGSTPDRIPIEHLWTDSGGNDFPVFGVRANGQKIYVYREGSVGNVYAYNTASRTNVPLDTSKWQLRVTAWA